MFTFENLNTSLIGMSKVLIKEGIWRTTRGFKCLEIPYPVTIEITNPTDRYINIEGRKWNKFLPFVESLWISLGINDLDVLPGNYVKSLYDFSDDGHTWRAGYGTRIRGFSGISTDYNVKNPNLRSFTSGFVKTVDQLKYVIESFKRDINTRQAIIEIGDPVKDCFDENDNLKVTKDFPCSRSLQFMVVDGKLNCTLYIRSNDIFWGFSAVNVFNFTFMQEYIANILGLEIGNYYHIANNFHVYENSYDKIVQFSILNTDDYKSEFGVWKYKDKIESLNNFDKGINILFNYENRIRNNIGYNEYYFDNKFFDDWLKVIDIRWNTIDIPFENPYLNKLFKL
jgi:thymidylate synthase